MISLSSQLKCKDYIGLNQVLGKITVFSYTVSIFTAPSTWVSTIKHSLRENFKSIGILVQWSYPTIEISKNVPQVKQSCKVQDITMTFETRNWICLKYMRYYKSQRAAELFLYRKMRSGNMVMLGGRLHLTRTSNSLHRQPTNECNDMPIMWLNYPFLFLSICLHKCSVATTRLVQAIIPFLNINSIGPQNLRNLNSSIGPLAKIIFQDFPMKIQDPMKSHEYMKYRVKSEAVVVQKWTANTWVRTRESLSQIFIG